MFGYVRPVRQELKVREWEDYNAVYCGLCHTLGRRYGFLPRLFLSYDFVFLAMLLSRGKQRPQTQQRRCIACPHKKKCVMVEEEGLTVSADESVILTYHQLRDTVSDSGFWKASLARCLSLLLRPAYQKAAAYRPDFDAVVRTSLQRLSELEKERCDSMDAVADTFAQILSAAAPETGEQTQDRAMTQLLYHVGRWIYLLDAWDDQAEDRKTGQYNPLFYRFPDGAEHHKAEFRSTLLGSLDRANAAFHLLESGYWEPVLGNILCIGLPAVEEAVFCGVWKKNKKRRRHDV